MSITLLKTLLAVHDTGSFAGASGRVHVTQAAVGQQMKRLEEKLGASLFDRSRKAPVLNATGNAMIPRAREVVAAYDALLESRSTPLSGELILGAVPSTLRGLVPQAVKCLLDSTPDLGIRVVPGLSEDLLEQVERGALDAAITSAPGAGNAALRWQHVTQEPLVLITGPDQRETDPLKLLRTEPYIRHTRRATAGILAGSWLRKSRITPRTAMELESIETVASMVAHGLGIAIVPDICVPDETFKKLRKLTLNPPMMRDLGILTRTDCTKMPLVDRLFEEIQKVIPVK